MSLNTSITSQGGVKFNAQRDVSEHHRRKKARKNSVYAYPNADPGDDSDLSIMPRDLCLRRRVKSQYKRMYTDTDINVFSSANRMFNLVPGLPPMSAKDLDNKRDWLRDMRSQFDFGGIAVTPARCDQNGAPGGEKNCVVLFGGSFTIRNTGDEDIYSGQHVMWDLPDPISPTHTWTSDQVPRTKLVFQTKPFTLENKYSLESAAERNDLVAAAQQLVETKGDEVPFASAMQAFEARFMDGPRRVFGRAVSSAKPGKEFDIILGRYMA